jgi:hypothetical protein
MSWLRSRDGATDSALAVLIFAATVIYLTSLPPNLAFADEAIHLYESKRILDGEVLYRDVFEMITPGFMSLMALLFSIFGTTLATARTAQAVIHGITAVALFATCRRLGIRRGLSWPAALAYVVVCQAAWPVVSQHWLSTMFCVLALLTCVDLPRDRARAAVVPGMMLGLLIAVQHQRGAIVAVGVFVWVILDALLQRRMQPQQPVAPLAARLAWLVGGALIIDVPMIVAVILYAGFQHVWRALVIFPLFDYRGSTYCEWGHINIMTHLQGTYTFPRLLKYLPLILPISAVRLLRLLWRGEGAAEARRLTLLLTQTLFAMLSIWYFPDFIHIAFIAAYFFAIIAETLEWLVARIPAPAGVRRAAGWAAAVVVLLAAGYRLEHNRNRLLAAYPFMRSTQFGEIALPDQVNAELYDKVNALVPDLPGHEIYCYPVIAHLYLMTGAHNPTPYGFLTPGYSGPDLIQHVVDILTAKKLPYLVVFFLRPEDDPISDYIRREYEPLDDPSPAAKYIYRRKDAAALDRPSDHRPS